jgi:hypothetical protein
MSGARLYDHITSDTARINIRHRVIDGHDIIPNLFGKHIIPGGQREGILMKALLPLE